MQGNPATRTTLPLLNTAPPCCPTRPCLPGQVCARRKAAGLPLGSHEHTEADHTLCLTYDILICSVRGAARPWHWAAALHPAAWHEPLLPHALSPALHRCAPPRPRWAR